MSADARASAAALHLMRNTRHLAAINGLDEARSVVFTSVLVGHTLTIRLQDDLAEWVEQTVKAMGVSQGRLIRDQLERARRDDTRNRRFMRLAGSVRLAEDLSTGKGFRHLDQ